MNIPRLAAMALVASTLAGCGPAPEASRQPPLAGARIGGPFALVDQDGRATTDRTFAGKYRVMYFGYTFCPDVCPLDMRNVGAGLKLLEASDPKRAARVVPVFVTVDPDRDTPAVLRQFVSAFHPRMVGLTGSPEAIAAAEKAYAVYAKKGTATPGGYLMDHSRQAILMDPDNRPLALIPSEESPQAVADALGTWVS